MSIARNIEEADRAITGFMTEMQALEAAAPGTLAKCLPVSTDKWNALYGEFRELADLGYQQYNTPKPALPETTFGDLGQVTVFTVLAFASVVAIITGIIAYAVVRIRDQNLTDNTVPIKWQKSTTP